MTKQQQKPITALTAGLMAVTYGYKFTPETKGRKGGSGTRTHVFISAENAETTFQEWHRQAPAWTYWLIDARPATKSEIRAAKGGAA